MIHDTNATNPSGNRSFHEILHARVSRRNVLAKGMFLSAAGFVTAVAGNKAFVQPAAAASGVAQNSFTAAGGGQAVAQAPQLLGFNPLSTAEATGPEPSISSDYQYEVLIPWGTPLKPGISAYNGDPSSRPSAQDQADMVGIGHDGMWFFPEGDSNDKGTIAINHEFGTNPHVLGKDVPESLSDVELSQHAHGVTVVEVEKQGGSWQVVESSPKNRRIHVNTPVAFSGPVAGDPLLQTPAGNAPQGTVNNCANGYTPWGTYLTCEENFNGYFGSTLGRREFEGVDDEGNGIDGIVDKRSDPQKRYGFSATGFGYGWHLFDPRFDLSNPDYKNEENRFGWVVEIDPADPNQMPVKRTAMGRVKHEGAALTIGKGGRVVAYMGDDGRFEYCYKYVSRGNWRSMINRGISPLDEGDLYVAKFNDDGTGEWLLLDYDANPTLKNSELSSQAEVLTFTRTAGDIVGATPMDRPEWTTVAPDGKVFWALTNNSQREEPNAPNPLAPNPHGHIITTEDDDNHVGTSFRWDIFILAGDTHAEDSEETFSDPDGLWADPDGRLFIETDGGQEKNMNNQMTVANTITGEIRRIFAGPADCEVTGIAVTPDRRTMFINVQHPGDGDPSVSNFPAPFEANGNGPIPRDATVVITRKDGGIIGS